MNHWAKPVSILSLVMTILPPVLLLLKIVDENTMKAAMLLATVGWFAASPYWLRES